MPDNFSDAGRASTVDYAALPGPGGRKSLIPPVDARWWTLKVALSQRPWSFLASGAMAVAFVCNGVTPVVVGRAVDDAVTTASAGRLALWIGVLAGVFVVAILANWTARFMLVRSQQLVSHDLRTQVTDRIQDPRGFAGRDRTPGGLLSIASSDTTRVGDIVMMTVMPVAEAAAIIYGAAVMYTINPWLSVGTLIGGMIPFVLALIDRGVGVALLMLLIVVVVHLTESHVLQPLMMGHAVALHPLAVILVVAANTYLFGIVGALFAVPLIAMVNSIVRYLANRDTGPGVVPSLGDLHGPDHPHGRDHAAGGEVGEESDDDEAATAAAVTGRGADSGGTVSGSPGPAPR